MNSGLFDLYTGAPGRVHDTPVTLSPPVLGAHADETEYFPDDGLVSAVNVAFALGQPLLLAGPPGCGKTQLAYSVARELGFTSVEKVSAASTTELGDLYYSFDHMSQYRDIQTPGRTPVPHSYLQVSGLGRALLLAGGPGARIEHAPGNVYDREGLSAPQTAAELMPEGFFANAAGTRITEPTASVVLVDEIDKAPRDVPNDMLGWLETMSFEVAELGLRIAPFDARLNKNIQARRPAIFFTTNGEKRLPDPFLRRCAYYSIPFPDTERLMRILAGRGLPEGVLVRDALALLMVLRSEGSGLIRPPGLAEFIGWVVLLVHRMDCDTAAQIPPRLLRASLPALFKLDDDLKEAERTLRDRLEVKPDPA